MSQMEKAYNPAAHEGDVYKRWEESGAFKPAGDPKKPPFSIIMPPPNANGHIHVGTAMFVIEDILTRYHRMKGDPTLWLPGTDHAGIETQVVYEKKLKAEGKSRFDLGPERFYKDVMKFTREHQDIMLSELKSMGFSADWSRLKFTLDDNIIEIVYDTFQKLHDDGLVYRANRIVNWCPRCNAAFADIEIKHREQIDPLYYIKYGPFVLATVRPETKFGDTAVAVHPDDERYQKYIGKEIEAEGILGKMKLKVIADTYVNLAFGTGVVKVTPAHDPNDWEMGLRHNLEVKQAIGTDGRLTKIAGKFAGMLAVEAREEVARHLEELGQMDHIDMNYTHSVAYHDRCNTLIEPLVTEQWWVKVEPLVKPAITAIENGDIQIVPARFKKAYVNWLENLRDWNISRQIWWGIKIPVYYNANESNGKKPYIIATDEQEAIDYYGPGNYEAETDTFDTWFSSSQWPFATLMTTGDYDQFYPTSVMETGRDILYLWVTRMVMLGIYRTEKVPFKTIYLHGMVNDAQGKKMSKSKGNVINPLELTGKFGTDALRLALTIGITPGNDGALGENKVEGYRNFNNKLWNVARFILERVEGRVVSSEGLKRDEGGVARSEDSNFPPLTTHPSSLADVWMLDRLAKETKTITRAIEAYRFSEAGERVYSLLWNDFADWYIEASKVDMNPGVLMYGLETILKLAHPFAPFVTEAIWSQLPDRETMLITAPWPEAERTYPVEATKFEQIMALVSQIRAISNELGVSKPDLIFSPKHPNAVLITEQQDLIKSLAKVGEIGESEVAHLTSSGSARGEQRGLRIPTNEFEAWLDVDPVIIQKYVKTLTAKRTEAGEYAKRLKGQLANKRYVDSAPANLVQQTRDRLTETEQLAHTLDEQISSIQE